MLLLWHFAYKFHLKKSFIFAVYKRKWAAKKYIVPLLGLFRYTQFSSCESISQVIIFGAVWKTLLSTVNCGAYHTNICAQYFISFKRMSRCFSLSALCKWSVSVPDVTCAASESSCQDGTCIPISSWCNQVIDCADASDEKNCSKAALPMLQSSTRYLYPTIIIIILTYQIIIDYKCSAFLDLTKFSHHLVALISFKTCMTLKRHIFRFIFSSKNLLSALSHVMEVKGDTMTKSTIKALWKQSVGLFVL